MIPKRFIMKLEEPIFDKKKVHVYVYRLDQLHPDITGNKWFKLKYNLIQARKERHTRLLSFGGAYSNHIQALATAGKKFNFQTIGLIRGEECRPLNQILHDAQKNGMHLHYIDRKTYREKHTQTFIQSIQKKWSPFYLIPEGGTNTYALKGCGEILNLIQMDWNYLCVPCGTGGTLAGLVSQHPNNNSQKIIGIPVLKNAFFLKKTIENLCLKYNPKLSRTTLQKKFELIFNYHFGGYAKKNPLLEKFIYQFKETHNIPIEPIYTGKMFYGIYDLILKNFFPPHSKIVILHTGQK